jgi:hypothetical protein
MMFLTEYEILVNNILNNYFPKELCNIINYFLLDYDDINFVPLINEDLPDSELTFRLLKFDAKYFWFYDAIPPKNIIKYDYKSYCLQKIKINDYNGFYYEAFCVHKNISYCLVINQEKKSRKIYIQYDNNSVDITKKYNIFHPDIIGTINPYCNVIYLNNKLYIINVNFKKVLIFDLETKDLTYFIIPIRSSAIYTYNSKLYFIKFFGSTIYIYNESIKTCVNNEPVQIIKFDKCGNTYIVNDEIWNINYCNEYFYFYIYCIESHKHLKTIKKYSKNLSLFNNVIYVINNKLYIIGDNQLYEMNKLISL